MDIIIINPRIWEEVENMVNEGYLRLPVSALRDKRLTLSDAAVLAVIIDRADTAELPISSAAIAKAAACSVRTAKAAIAKLEEYGYITVTRREGYTSLYRHNSVLPPKKDTRARKSRTRAAEALTEQEAAAYSSVVGELLY